MVLDVVSGEYAPEPEIHRQVNVDRDQVHVIFTPIELDIVVDALHSVGNVELAQRLEGILRQFWQGRRGERPG